MLLPTCSRFVHVICLRCLITAVFDRHCPLPPTDTSASLLSICDESDSLARCPLCKAPSHVDSAPAVPNKTFYQAVFGEVPLVEIESQLYDVQQFTSAILILHAFHCGVTVVGRPPRTLRSTSRVAGRLVWHSTHQLSDFFPTVKCYCGTSLVAGFDVCHGIVSEGATTLSEQWTDHLEHNCPTIHCAECGLGPAPMAVVRSHAFRHRLHDAADQSTQLSAITDTLRTVAAWIRHSPMDAASLLQQLSPADTVTIANMLSL